MATGARFMAVRSKPSSSIKVTSKLISSPFPSSSNRTITSASRLASMMGMVESQQPLHSAIASARLKSSLALDSSCWSCLSQGSLAELKSGMQVDELQHSTPSWTLSRGLLCLCDELYNIFMKQFRD
ncbi:Shikimate kinase [Bienertia sinuspersici]